MSVQVGASCLEKERGGRGVLLSGVPGVAPANVVILGAGVAGSNAAHVALGMGANVTVVDRSLPALRRAVDRFGPALNAVFSTHDDIARLVAHADLVIGAVLVAGATTPKLVTAGMVKTMQPGSVLVDIAIDQGGCFETSHATTHAEPTFLVDGVVHYCVANMPGAVARTSTFALHNATLPFALALANKGWRRALSEDIHLRNGLNVHDGKVTCKAVAEALNLPYTPAETLLLPNPRGAHPGPRPRPAAPTAPDIALRYRLNAGEVAVFQEGEGRSLYAWKIADRTRHCSNQPGKHPS
jgi:alanine dehydrogenase